ncbi:MAG: 3-hydroxyacyl-CoA dehydrogenase [Pseudolabrys sp.]
MNKIGIIGAGLIGRAWAIVFARAGWSVTLYDSAAEVRARVKSDILASLQELTEYGLGADIAAAEPRIHVADTIAKMVEGASFVQENGPETIEAKLAIFGELDRLAPADAILASSSSAIVASRFTEKLKTRVRCLVAHPVNPPHLVPIVELAPAPWTSPDTVSRAKAIYESVGQVPILVKKEVEGFILNRLQGALLAEAFRLVGEGYVSPRDLDKTIKDGLGLRWSFLGPFATIELNAPGGVADYCARYLGFYRRLQDDPPNSAYTEANLKRVMKQWDAAPVTNMPGMMKDRDTRLAALRAHKAKFKD